MKAFLATFSYCFGVVVQRQNFISQENIVYIILNLLIRAFYSSLTLYEHWKLISISLFCPLSCKVVNTYIHLVSSTFLTHMGTTNN